MTLVVAVLLCRATSLRLAVLLWVSSLALAVSVLLGRATSLTLAVAVLLGGATSLTLAKL